MEVYARMLQSVTHRDTKTRTKPPKTTKTTTDNNANNNDNIDEEEEEITDQGTPQHTRIMMTWG
jgi:hypothetical protein